MTSHAAVVSATRPCSPPFRSATKFTISLIASIADQLFFPPHVLAHLIYAAPCWYKLLTKLGPGTTTCNHEPRGLLLVVRETQSSFIVWTDCLQLIDFNSSHKGNMIDFLLTHRSCVWPDRQEEEGGIPTLLLRRPELMKYHREEWRFLFFDHQHHYAP